MVQSYKKGDCYAGHCNLRFDIHNNIRATETDAKFTDRGDGAFCLNAAYYSIGCT